MMPDDELQQSRLKDRKGEIFPLYEAFYIEALLFNCNAARSAILQLAALCALDIEINEIDRIARILDEAQSFVLHAGALSRFLWPVRKNHSKRGEQLRAALQVEDTSPLADRAFRDSLEHFDERLDLYLCQDLVGYVFPQTVGHLDRASDVHVHRFRAFDPSTGIFELLGKQYELNPLVEQLIRVHALLENMRQTGRFHFTTADPCHGPI